MKKQNGFTLIEVLFVLSIWSILFLLSGPLNMSILTKQQEKQFFEAFESDLLYLQTLSYGYNENRLRLSFIANEEMYAIFNGKDEIRKKQIPANWQVDTRNVSAIAFDKNGRIRQAGRIEIITPLNTYHLVFPFGKRRGYIEKQ
ncbi:competence type IV pilus minor pilin ComGD [Oceanobacillus halotolerans]|uniref:competence type IV pilus minor pilin ComGD n=1 Tax=Oceanobacillus halotolerans TaxID=2663380 RepID=UPI0013DA561F|nr:competence type IV pilus minor pilin ComGD [Oceanobacillus halotolerans]